MILGSYSNMIVVKTRSVVQVVIEVPIERGSEITDLLGFPNPSAEIPVVIARMNQEMLAARKEAEEQAQDEQFTAPALDAPRARKPLSQVAAVLCGVVAFRRYLTEECGAQIAGADEAADWLRSHCGVKSRRELDHNDIAAAKFKRLRDHYDTWMRVVA